MKLTARIFLLISLVAGSAAFAEVCQLYPIAISSQVTGAASVGDVFRRVATGSGPGNYSFLSWTGANNTPTLANSLTPPGDFETWSHPDDSSDTTPDPGDWIQGGPGVKNARAIRDALDLLIGEDITVVEWSDTRGQGSNFDYQIARLIVVELTEYKLNGKGYFSWIFKGESDCGQPAVCEAETLGLAGEYNALVFGDFHAQSSDVQGRMAIGGDLDINHYSIADQLAGDTAGTSVIVGGDFDFPSGRIYYGDVVVGGEARLGAPVLNGLSADQSVSDNAALPIDFTAERARLESLSSRLFALPTNGTYVFQWGGFTLSGDGASPLQVFALDGDDVLSAHTFNVDGIPPGATVVFNISGATTGLTNMSLASLEPIRNRVLFNFPQATMLTLSGIAVEGSILAPLADIDQPQGVIKGNLVADRWDGIMQLNHAPFAGCFPGLESNQQPLADDQSLTTEEDTPLLITLTGSDADGDALTFTVDALPVNGTLSGTAPDLIYTPNAEFAGMDGFEFTVSDGELVSGTATVELTINPVNDAPTADDKAATLGEDTSTIIGLTGSDIDGDALTFFLVDAPQSGSVSLSGDQATYIPDADYHGADQFTYIANDGTAASAPAVVTLQILPLNDAPVAHNLGTTTPEDTAVTITLVGSDADGDALTYSAVSLTANGTLSLAGNTATYSPDADYAGSDSFTYVVNDGTVDSSIATVTVDVSAVNDLPTADSQAVETSEDTSVNIQLTGSDPEGSPLTYRVVSGPTSGNLSGAGANLVYTPDENYSGADVFTFVANDSEADSGLATVSLTVTPVNDAPIADPQSVSVDEDSSVTFALSGSDIESDPLTFSLQDLPANGVAARDGSTVTYTPSADYNGADTLTFLVNDGIEDSAAAQVQITVNPVNDPPSIDPLADAERIEGESFSVTAIANDVDGDPLTFAAEGLPAALTIDPVSGVINGIAQTVGPHLITVSVSDPDGATASASFTLLITQANMPPVALNQSLTAVAGEPTPVTLSGTDEDGDALTYRVITGPTSGTVSGDAPDLVYIADAEFEGTDSLTFVANDGAVDSTEATVTITVSIPNRPPEIVSTPVTRVDEGAVYEYDVDAVDPDLDVLSYAIDEDAAGLLIDPLSGILTGELSDATVSGVRTRNLVCRRPVQPIEFGIETAWQWLSPNADSGHEVFGPVTVGQLSDDNGDGLINALDTPDVVFFSRLSANDPTFLNVVSGDTGSPIWSDQSLPYSSLTSASLGDVDNDGFMEIVVVLFARAEVAVLEHDGTLKWRSPVGDPHNSRDRLPRDAAFIADLNGDGLVEVVNGRYALDGRTGERLWSGSQDSGGYRSYGYLSVVADIDLDGLQNVIAGRTVYGHDGAVLWHRGDLPGDGYTAVGNLDADPSAEIVLVTNGRVFVLDTDGATLWSKYVPGGGTGGPPTIGDFDGDGEAEIATVGRNQFVVYDTDGTQLWSSTIQDFTSNQTGSSLFDFDGDGRPEIVYADEINLYIWDAATGELRFSEPNLSGTVLEYPVIADIDKDGEAEILLGSSGDGFGLRALESAGDPWMPTRSIWNQHAYSITNVNDDGTIPAYPEPSWLTHNTFRLNTFADRGPLDQVDLALFDIALNVSADTVSVTAVNRGLAPSDRPVLVELYDGAQVIAQWTVESLAAGQELLLSAPVEVSSLSNSLAGSIDVTDAVAECIEDNNTTGAAVIRVRATDPEDLFDTQTFSVVVDDVNETPVILTDALPAAVVGATFSVFIDAADPDTGDALRYVLIDAPQGMTLEEVTGEIHWSDEDVLAGTFDVTVQVVDLGGLSDTRSYTLDGVLPNTPPVANSLSVDALTAQPIEIQLSGSDDDGDEIVFSVVDIPLNGSLSGTAPDITYTSDAAFEGADFFTFVTNDGSSDSSPARVDINVVQPNRAPEIVSTPVTSVDEYAIYEYDVDAVDPDSDALTYSLDSGDGSLAMDTVTGNFSGLISGLEAQGTRAANAMCRLPYFSTIDEPELLWSIPQPPSFTAYGETEMTPVVAYWSDDNGDGQLGRGDVPHIFYTSYANVAGNPGIIRIVRGTDGVEVFAITSHRISWAASLAVGDVDADGDVEIFAAKEGGAFVAFDSDGSVLWERNGADLNFVRLAAYGPVLTDLNGDGLVELIVGKTVLNALTGETIWTGAGAFFGRNVQPASSDYYPVVGDILDSPGLEVIVGASVYSAEGDLLWQNDIVGDGYTGIVDTDSDGEPEIVVVSGGNVYLLNAFGDILWGPVVHPGNDLGGHPTMADVDQDGFVEIGVSGRNKYALLNHDGTTRWTLDVSDVSIGAVTGSAMFDFNGDDRAEVLVIDNFNVYIVDGPSGVIVRQIPGSTGTGTEYPVIADVNADGTADIVVVANDDLTGPIDPARAFDGLYVHTAANGEWMPTRSVWNQHAYSITNVNDDGTIPAYPEPSWLTHNTFRLNTFADRGPLDQADLALFDISLDESAGTVSVTAVNRGLAPAENPVVVELSDGAQVVAQWTVESLAAGQELILSAAVDVSSLAEELAGSIDTVDAVTECIESNNSTSAAVIRVRATDPEGLFDSQTFTVVADNVNEPPAIVTQALFDGTAGELYSTFVGAEDPDVGDALKFDLLEAPANMSIHPVSGQIRWLGTFVETGTYPITVVVSDLGGLSVQRTFSLEVFEGNQPPIAMDVFASAEADSSIEVLLNATDPNDDPISFSVLEQPSNGTLAGVPPTLVYTPDAGFTGVDAFTYLANDGYSDSNVATVAITIGDVNVPPSITSTPPTAGEEGVSYSYAVMANDPNGDLLTFVLTQFPSGMSMNDAGVISWVPSSVQIGDNAVTVEVSDGLGGVDTQSFVITVTEPLDNRGPQVTSVPPTYTKEGRAYSYQMIATDPDGDALNYTLIDGPPGMTVDTAGLLTWTASAENDYPITLRVDDSQAFVDQDWTLTVLQDSVFDFDIVFDPSPVENEPFILTLVPENAAGTVDALVEIDGLEVSLDAGLSATLTLDAGGHSIFASASDALDYVEKSGGFVVEANSNNDPPVVQIITPDFEERVTAPIDVIATVQDDNLAAWRLVAIERGTSEGWTLAEGTEAFENMAIAEFDPTMLLNGMYTIQLEALDASGNSAFDNRHVIVDGDLKVGHFSITFEDMSVPVAGIPITVTRTYDTRQSHKNMDFGYGWSVDYQNVRVQESRTIGLGWDIFEFDQGFFSEWCVLPFGDPIVSVTLPDGDVERFRAKASPECTFPAPEENVRIVFEPIGDTDSELVQDNFGLLRVVGTNLVDIDQLSVPVDPQNYTLTTPEGYQYKLNQGFTVDRVIDPNGNTLTFTEDGIFHSSGESLEFVRDGQGRITQIIAPDGTTTNYDYTPSGDLERFRDPLDHGTEFTYLARIPHYLEDIIDPRGIRVARNEYDDDGRLVAHIDADGNRIEYTHDIEGRTEIIKDRRGNSTIYTYDDEGNVVAETNALGETTLREYDEERNETAMVDALGNRTEWTYDSRGNQLTETNALGEVTTSTYSNRNALLTQVDDAGVTVIDNTYDPNNGQLLSTTDALGNTTVFEYDSGIGSGETGELELMTDAENNTVQFFINSRTGRRVGEIDARGVYTEYVNDDMGRVTMQRTTRTDALGNPVTLQTSFVYDDKGNVTQTTHPDGSITRTEYNEIDKPIAEIDANGNRTEMEYDDRGNLVLTRYADGSTETTAYDEEGNTIAQIDRAGRTTRMVYDTVGRLVETIYFDETPLDDTDNPRTINEYDAAGRLVANINERGFRTEYEYDALGRRTLVRDALGNETTFEYNNRGHRIATVDARNKRTEFTYDDAGRLLRTTFHDGTFTETAYDGLGRKVSETDQAGRTTQFEYDEGGNLTAVVDALGQRTEYVYDEQSNKTVQRDAEGRETRWEYDDLGRVVARVLPEGERESFTYDDAGNRASRTDFNGITTTYSYDNLNRMTRTDYPDGTFVRTVYAITGQVDFMEDHRGLTDYSYDERDRLQRIDYPNGTFVEYDYDIAGNRIELTTPNQQVNYTYDALNRLSTVTDANGIATYGYDEVGNRAFTDYANGTRAEYIYDDLNRLLQLTNYDALGGIMTDHVYTLGDAGNRTQMAESLPTGTRVVGYVYDDLYRLVEEQVTDPVHGDQTITWTYDRVGNRQTQTVDDGTIVTTTYTYDDNDRLLTEVGTDSINYRYDANGNTLDKAVNGLVEVTYDYDFENRLIATDNATYAYDPAGVRQSKIENGQGVIYLVDPNRDYAQVIEEQDAMGQAHVIYSYGDDLLTQTRTEGTYQYHYDGLGSTRALSDVFGAESDSYIYSAFGELEEQAGTTPNTYLYTGEQFDPNLGWYYLRARYYNPSNGRFPTMDTWMGQSTDPRTLHKYVYGHQNPVTNFDPTGLFSISEEVARKQVEGILNTIAIVLLFNAMMDYQTASQRLEAMYIARQCARVGKKGCDVRGIPIIFYGNDVGVVRDHIAKAIEEKSIDPLLHYWSGHSRAWLAGTDECADNYGRAAETGLSCDEFPFASAAEGGQDNYPGKVSLELLDYEINTKAGRRLWHRLLRPCKVKKGLTVEMAKKDSDTAYVVVPAHGLEETYGQCSDGGRFGL